MGVATLTIPTTSQIFYLDTGHAVGPGAYVLELPGSMYPAAFSGVLFAAQVDVPPLYTIVPVSLSELDVEYQWEGSAPWFVAGASVTLPEEQRYVFGLLYT
jgi:hypothetical protein